MDAHLTVTVHSPPSAPLFYETSAHEPYVHALKPQFASPAPPRGRLAISFSCTRLKGLFIFRSPCSLPVSFALLPQTKPCSCLSPRPHNLHVFFGSDLALGHHIQAKSKPRSSFLHDISKTQPFLLSHPAKILLSALPCLLSIIATAFSLALTNAILPCCYPFRSLLLRSFFLPHCADHVTPALYIPRLAPPSLPHQPSAACLHLQGPAWPTPTYPLFLSLDQNVSS